MRILCVFAHPDDEVYCAGTLAKLSSNEENQIRCIYMNNGVGLWRKNPLEPIYEKVKNHQLRIDTRLDELKNSMAILFISEFKVYDFPNIKMDTIPQQEINQVVEAEIQSWKPELVITHYGNDLNEDHRRTFVAVKIATRLRPDSIVKAVICTDNDQSRDVFKPNLFIDIRLTLPFKKRCMMVYRSEYQKPPGERNEDTMELIAKYSGYKAGLTASENFQILFILNDFKLF